MNISDNLKRLRKEKRLTQKKLAEISGVSENAIKQYETNKRTPRIEQLTLLAEALDTTTSNLMGTTIFYEKQVEILNDLVVSDSIEHGQIRTGYQHLLVSLERLLGKFPDDEEIILSILTRFMFMIEGLYLNVGNNSPTLVSKDLAIIDELTSKLSSLLGRDTVFHPLGDLNKYNALSQKDILEINTLLNDGLKNRLARYMDAKDSDN